MGHYENVCNRKRFRDFLFSGRGAKVRTQAEGGHLNGSKQSYGDGAAMNESKHALNYTKRRSKWGWQASCTDEAWTLEEEEEEEKEAGNT